jgi:F0F1-type ATP synthase membrane subunit b/b'
MKSLRALLNKKGQGATEYILILAVLVAIILMVNKYMPGMFKDFITKVSSKVSTGIDSAAQDKSGGN